MLRVVRSLPAAAVIGGQVAHGIAAIRLRDLQSVVASNVAVGAGIDLTGRRQLVRISQQESRGVVVESRSVPTVKGVAGLASRREVCRYVVRNIATDALGAIQIRLVTGNASRGKSLELANRCILMAVLALQGGVRTEEREAVLVIFDLLDCNIPTLDGVALGAVRAHLALVDVHVAVFAILSDVRKNGLHVALHAVDLFVHAAQRVASLVVVKLRGLANGFPDRRRVAVLARNREGTVRTLGSLPRV